MLCSLLNETAILVKTLKRYGATYEYRESTVRGEQLLTPGVVTYGRFLLMFAKETFLSATISACFADDFGNSERAVDLGGPRREYLRLLVKAANEHSGIFGRPADRRVLVPNSNGRYFIPTVYA